MDPKPFFDEARKLAGGKLSTDQVKDLNEVVDKLIPSADKMDISAEGLKLIQSFEGLRLKAYDDGVGVWTIGYGTIKYPNGVKVKSGDVCTESQANEYMKHDLEGFVSAVNKLVTVPLKQNQFDALVSLMYNIGQTNFANSTLLKKLNTGNYKDAAAQFNVWNRAGGRVMQGLINRRAAERKVFEK